MPFSSCLDAQKIPKKFIVPAVSVQKIFAPLCLVLPTIIQWDSQLAKYTEIGSVRRLVYGKTFIV